MKKDNQLNDMKPKDPLVEKAKEFLDNYEFQEGDSIKQAIVDAYLAGAADNKAEPIPQRDNTNTWPDEVRLLMIERSELYSDPRIYQYGYYDGYQKAQSESPNQLEELIAAYDEYIKLFDAELSELYGLHIAHGWKGSSRAEAGKACREKISELKKIKFMTKSYPYNLCPKCNGNGWVFTPYGTTTNVTEQCNVCFGAKILAPYVTSCTKDIGPGTISPKAPKAPKVKL